MDSSLRSPSNGFRGKQTLNKLRMLKIDVCAKSPQAGSLAVLILYIQTLTNKPEKGQTDSFTHSHQNPEGF